MRKKICAAVAAGCLLFSAVGVAAPTTMGSTGLIDAPSADVLREGQLFFGYYHLHEGNAWTIGAGLSDRFEVGFSQANYDRGGDKSYLNFKYALHTEGLLIPGIAVGLEDVTDESDRSAYVALSKGLPLGFRLHAGYGGGRYDGFFYAVEKRLNPLGIGGVFPDTSLIVEHDGHAMNYGMRMSLLPGLKLNAGWRDGDPYVGATYNLY